MSEKEASFRMYQEDALKKDWLTTYPLPESGLSIEGVRSMGLEAATKKLFEIWGGVKDIGWQVRLNTFLQNLFPDNPERQIRDVVFKVSVSQSKSRDSH